MLSNRLTITFTVKKKVWTKVTVGSKEVDHTVEIDGAGFKGYLQQATPEYAQYFNLTMTKGYSLWCPLSSDVFEGDTIYDGQVAYLVRARQDYRDGENPHAQLAVELIGIENDGS
jgi:hypothetical protein